MLVLRRLRVCSCCSRLLPGDAMQLDNKTFAYVLVSFFFVWVVYVCWRFYVHIALLPVDLKRGIFLYAISSPSCIVHIFCILSFGIIADCLVMDKDKKGKIRNPTRCLSSGSKSIKQRRRNWPRKVQGSGCHSDSQSWACGSRELRVEPIVLLTLYWRWLNWDGVLDDAYWHPWKKQCNWTTRLLHMYSWVFFVWVVYVSLLGDTNVIEGGGGADNR